MNLYLFQENVILNPCFRFSKNLILSLIGIVTTGTKSFALFIWNVALFVLVATSYSTGSVSGTALDVLDIWDIIQYLDHDKSCSISRLIKGKLRDLQKLLKYLNAAITSESNL